MWFAYKSKNDAILWRLQFKKTKKNMAAMAERQADERWRRRAHSSKVNESICNGFRFR